MWQGWGAADVPETTDKKSSKDDRVINRLKSKTEIDSYAECYPGLALHYAVQFVLHMIFISDVSLQKLHRMTFY